MAEIKYLDKTGLGTVKSILDGLFATKAHTHNLGDKAASDLSSTYPTGISVGGIYNNGYPFAYGATITACGNGGYFQIAGQWNSAVTSLTDYDKPTEMYIRGRRDSYDVWTTWSRVLTNRNYTSCINTTNFPGINKTGTVTKVSTGTGLTGGDITSTGTISINSTYQTYISNGNTAHGWGNHANAGYVKSSGVTKVSTGTGLTGGDITSTGTVSINSTYQTYISNGNTAHGWGNHANAGYMKISQYGYSPNTYTFNIGQNDIGWIYLGYIYGSNSGLKIECDYASHCGNDYGLFASHLVLGVRPYSLEGFISKVKGSSGGLYITEESASNGYKNYRVYIYLKAWYQGQVRISTLGYNEFVWSKTEEAPNSSHTVVLDTRELDGYYTCHKGIISKASLEGHTHGYWTWNENTIKGVKVNNAVYADSAGSASRAATLSGGSIATWGTLTSGNGYTNVCTWDTGNTTGAFSLAGKGGQMSLQLDGYFYQNEGANRVTDVTETVTGLGTSGNYLTWTKNGSANNITVPYATLAGKLQASSNTITTTSNDTTSKWGALRNTIHFYATTGQLIDQPSQYGLLLNFNSSSEVHQLWLTQASGDAYHRGGNSSGWSGTWRKFLDSSNYTTYTVKKDGTGASGTWGINITGNANYANSAGSAVDQTARDAAAAKLPLAGGTMTGGITFTNSQALRWHDSDSYSISYPTGGNGAYLLMRAYEGATVSKRLTVYKSSSATTMPNTSYTIYTNGTIGAAEGFFDSSDERLKDFYDDIAVDFDKLKAIPKKYFSWKDDENKELHLGTSAQAVQEIYPEIVNSDDNGNLSVSYNKLAIVALAAVDKLYDKINKIEQALIDKGIL